MSGIAVDASGNVYVTGFSSDNAFKIDFGCPTMAPPTLVVNDHTKNRYLSLVPGNAGEEVALRVTLGALDGFPGYEGTELWVGPPQDYPEEDISDPGRTFVGASLSCDPHFMDWGTIDVLQVFGGEVVPDSAYQVHTIHVSCAAVLDQVSDFGIPAELWSGKWGDVASLFDGDDPGAPQPDFNDVAAIVQKFLADPSAPIKACAQLQPNVVMPVRPVDFKDIAMDVQAFLDVPYATLEGMSGGCACPSSVTCGATACDNDLDCGNGFCIDDFCTDACGRCSP